MSVMARRPVLGCALLSAIAVLYSCSSAPAGPEKGTPAFSWQAARETFAAGDYAKTAEHLDNVIATDNEFSARALPWLLILNAGQADGYAELADNYSLGARMNKSDPASFRKLVSDYRGAAGRLSLQVAEDVGKLDKLKGDAVALAFAYPKGAAGPVAQFTKIVNGIALPAADIEAVQKKAIERNILLATFRAAGAPDDAAKTQQILSTTDAQVPKATFLAAMAQELYNSSLLFSRDKLDDPQKMTIFCDRAQAALKSVPETKETKDLAAKIQAVLKKGKKT